MSADNKKIVEIKVTQGENEYPIEIMYNSLPFFLSTVNKGKELKSIKAIRTYITKILNLILEEVHPPSNLLYHQFDFFTTKKYSMDEIKSFVDYNKNYVGLRFAYSSNKVLKVKCNSKKCKIYFMENYNKNIFILSYKK